MLATPSYIPIDLAVGRALTFPWDEWRVFGYYHRDLDVWWPRLRELTIRAQLTLTIAVGEWVYHRFDAVNSDTTPLRFIEAAWAGAVHPAYCRYFENDDDQWRGVVRNPLKTMMVIINDALFHMNEDPDVGLRAAWMFNLAEHLLPGTALFERWFSRVVARLLQYHPRSGSRDDLFSFGPPGLGSPVPREAFDPERPYQREEDTVLVDQFLSSLNPRENDFLRPSDEVAAADDFEGVPYRFNS
jgi:hypothetical protein